MEVNVPSHSWLSEQWRKRGILSHDENINDAFDKIAKTSWFVRRNYQPARRRGGKDYFANQDQPIPRRASFSGQSAQHTLSHSPAVVRPSRLRSFVESNIPNPLKFASCTTLAARSSSSVHVDITFTEDTQVHLTVYDLSSCWNALCHPLGIGAYHSAIEVGGVEYMYNGVNSIFEAQADSIAESAHAVDANCGVTWHTPLFDDPAFTARMRLIARISLGESQCKASDCHEMLRALASLEYLADDYHFLHHNCNHWSISAAGTLGVTTPPSWLNRLSDMLAFCSGMPTNSATAKSPKGAGEVHHVYQSSSTSTPALGWPSRGPVQIKGSPLRKCTHAPEAHGFLHDESIDNENESLLSNVK